MKKRIISALLAIYLLLQLTPCTPVGVSASSVQHDIYEFDGNYYQLFDVSIAWTEAMAYCESLGGHLVTITSAEEQAFIETLLESGEKKQYWIGMRFMENEYRWITGEIVGYTNWAPYQPDRCCYEGVYEDYIQIYNEAYGRNNPRYKWNDCYDDNYFRNDPSADFSRPENVGFICEWESKKAESNLVYLEDLVISNSARYTGNQGDSFINVLGTRNGKTDIHGNTMEHGLEAWIARWNFKNEVSWAWVEYALNGQYSVLSGKLTIISDCYNSTNFDSTIEIIGDGNILYSSALTPGMAVEDVRVDISGVSTLRIYVYDNTSVKGGTSFGLWDFAVGDGKQCVHKWSAGQKTKEQTCTEGGEITYTCTLCSETKTEELLPLGHDYIARTCTRCGKRDFILEYDTWSFDNSRTSFGSSAEGYYISYSDWDRLTSNLPNIEVAKSLLYSKTVISKEYPEYQRIVANYNVDNALGDEDCVDWGGSCYGMSTWVCLNSYGIRKASDIDGSTSSLSLYNNRAEVESAINYYHYQQRLPNSIVAEKEFMSRSQREQLMYLEELGKKANISDAAFLIGLQWYPVSSDGSIDKESLGAHAVVGYGWEEIEPTKFTNETNVDVSNIEFTYRILIYDCSDPNQSKGDRNLYYNDDGIWYIPGWHIVSKTSDISEDNTNNGRLGIVTADAFVLNGIDYITGDYAPQAPVTLLDTAAGMPYSIEYDGKSANIHGFSVTSETEEHGIFSTVAYNVTSDGTIIPATFTAILPDADSYRVYSENDSMMFSFKNDNYLTTCGIGSSGSMTFFPNGTVSVSADKDAPYYVNLVANDGYYDRPWQQIEIAGEGATEIAIEMADKGIIIRNDDLDTVTIAVTDDGGTTEISGSSDCESVLITDINGTPAVFEDADDNGTYETNITITECENPFNDVESGSFYYEPVIWAIENSITNGTSATTFGPNAICNRAQIVTFLYRAFVNE